AGVVWRQGRISQLLGLPRPAEDRDMRPVGVVEPGVQPLAPFLAFGQMLEEQPTRVPMGVALLGREPNQGRDLLGLGEIALRRFTQILALERYDALIALACYRLVEGDREIAL